MSRGKKGLDRVGQGAYDPGMKVERYDVDRPTVIWLTILISIIATILIMGAWHE